MYRDEPLQTFLDKLASRFPTPGGGAGSAVAGALGAALGSMVCNLTIGKKKYAQVENQMRTILEKTEALRKRFTELIDEDDQAFSALMDAFKMPKETADEKSARSVKIQETTKHAALIPLEIMKLCCDLIPLAHAGAVKGNPNVVSDAGVSAILAGAAAQAAALNVHINLLGIKDRKWAEEKFAEMNRMLKEVREGSDLVMQSVTKVLSGA